MDKQTKKLIDRKLTEINLRKNIQNPKRFFKKGDIVEVSKKECKIIEKINEYSYLLTKELEKKENFDLNKLIVSDWENMINIKKVANTSFANKKRMNVDFFKTPLNTLIFRNYDEFGGYNFNPEYQRDYVWSLEQKQDLIYSIFNNIDIGKFVLIPTDDNYEILDGKQRISTIINFYEDNFKYRGHYYSELSKADKNHFKSISINLAEVRQGMSLKEKYYYFICLNKKGVLMEKEHLEKVENEYLKL